MSQDLKIDHDQRLLAQEVKIYFLIMVVELKKNRSQGLVQHQLGMFQEALCKHARTDAINCMSQIFDGQ